MARGGRPKPSRTQASQEIAFRKALRLISAKCSVNMNPQSALTAAEVIQHIRVLADTALLGNPDD